MTRDQIDFAIEQLAVAVGKLDKVEHLPFYDKQRAECRQAVNDAVAEVSRLIRKEFYEERTR